MSLPILDKRRAGVILHPTSLPNKVLDNNSWLFVDWLSNAGFSIWQVLPLTEPEDGDISPYQCDSAFALNTSLLPNNWRENLHLDDYDEFQKRSSFWLENYAIFKVIKLKLNNKKWIDWPSEYKLRESQALDVFKKENQEAIEEIKIQQYAVYRQWQKIKEYANSKNILIFGDIPIFVSYESADVWSNPHLFKLDKNLEQEVVTGVPPDYFSEVGQRWGNPHYNWERMQDSGFEWWKERVASALITFDKVRIDHFRGLQASWEILATEPTAINGKWVDNPGDKLLDEFAKIYKPLPLIAEDLGQITPEVVALKDKYNLPGMSILQSGFDGMHDNPHAMWNQKENSVVYTGTHDNDTSLGWYLSLDSHSYDFVHSQLPMQDGEMPMPIIVAAISSPAKWAIITMQDILGLDSSSRMNVPGTTDGNWQWKFNWEQLPVERAMQWHKLLRKNNRLV